MEEKEPVDVVLDRVAYCDTECEQNYLRDGEECGTEDDITDGPAIVECAENEDELGNNIDYGANEGPEHVHDP